MTRSASVASVADHSIDPPQIVEPDGSATWVTRGSNFVVAVTRAAPGCRLRTQDLPDEHMILLPDTGAEVRAGDDPPRIVAGYHLVIAPPGNFELVAGSAGWIVRCFSFRATALLLAAGNAADYAAPRTEVAPLVDWPEPRGGFALRVYALDEGLQAGDKTRCYRSSNLMVNVLRERTTPRDAAQLSPHSHDDFEQGSIALGGRYIHHLRTPWGPDLRAWRDDEAVEVGSPSVVVIPPGIIHTTRNIGEAKALLVDFFCPPRMDFSRRPGMVRNADDYPVPEHYQSPLRSVI